MTVHYYYLTGADNQDGTARRQYGPKMSTMMLVELWCRLHGDTDILGDALEVREENWHVVDDYTYLL